MLAEGPIRLLVCQSQDVDDDDNDDIAQLIIMDPAGGGCRDLELSCHVRRQLINAAKT